MFSVQQENWKAFQRVRKNIVWKDKVSIKLGSDMTQMIKLSDRELNDDKYVKDTKGKSRQHAGTGK